MLGKNWLERFDGTVDSIGGFILDALGEEHGDTFYLWDNDYGNPDLDSSCDYFKFKKV